VYLHFERKKSRTALRFPRIRLVWGGSAGSGVHCFNGSGSLWASDADVVVVRDSIEREDLLTYFPLPFVISSGFVRMMDRVPSFFLFLSLSFHSFLSSLIEVGIRVLERNQRRGHTYVKVTNSKLVSRGIPEVGGQLGSYHR